jgi:hypothetical protein
MTTQTATTGSFASPTVLTRDGHRTIVLATVAASPDYFLKLPSGCLPDDIFEVFWTPIDAFVAVLLAPDGENFGIDSSGVARGSIGANGSVSRLVRKLNGTTWGVL